MEHTETVEPTSNDIEQDREALLREISEENTALRQAFLASDGIVQHLIAVAKEVGAEHERVARRGKGQTILYNKMRAFFAEVAEMHDAAVREHSAQQERAKA